MSTISIRRAHGLTAKQAMSVARKIAAQLQDEYGIKTTWNGESARIKGAGIDGELRLAPRQLALDLELGFMLLMFRDKITAGIEAKFDEVLPVKPRKKV